MRYNKIIKSEMPNYEADHRKMVVAKFEEAGGQITLDGELAHISGYCNRFPVVVANVSGISFQYAWATINHIIIDKNGVFKS